MLTKTRAILAVSLLLAGAAGARAGGVVSGCTEQALLDALAGGGVASFASDCSITLAAPLAIGAGTTTIDAQGHNVTISGAGAVQLFNVSGNLNLYGLTLANGAGSNGAALFVNSGTVLASNCTFIGNAATGSRGVDGAAGSNNSTGNGGDGGDATAGSPAFGGAIYNLGNVTLLGCTVVSNTATGGSGGKGGAGGNGAFNQGNGGAGGAGAMAAGGGIYNLGTLQVSNCTFTANQALAGAGGAGGAVGTGVFTGVAGFGAAGGDASGGAIYGGSQTVKVWSSTFTANQALAGASVGGGTWPNGNGQNAPAGGVGAGGAICNAALGAITNCTFYTNTAAGGNGGNGGNGSYNAGNGGDGGDGRGGGLYNTAATVAVNCTFANCAALGGTNGVAGTGTFAGNAGTHGRYVGGDIDNGAGSFTIMHCALGLASGGCGWDTIIDGGYNIIADATLPFSGTSLINTDPLLAALAANGGPTKTMALQTNSPCLDRVPAASSPAVDQRGVPRPLNGLADVGAYEYELASPPIISSHPADQVVAAAATVRFSVTAVGATPLTYQWRLLGAPISGGTASSYTATATLTNEGPYSVLVSNSLGTAVSSNAYFRIRATVTSAPSNQIVLPGATASFNVAATGDSPLAIQWQHDGIDIPGATASTYAVSNALPSATGTYTARVSNPYGTNSAGAVLGILPVVTSQPVDQRVQVGESATFSVAATGSAPLGYLWRFNGAPITGATLTAYTIPAAQAANAGRYDVVVTNAFGSTNSSAALLKVLYSITGTVSNNLAGVTVSIDASQSATTDANGNFSAQVSSGSYTLVPSKANYAFQPASITVSVPPSTNVTFAASRLFTISGTVNGVASNAPARVTVVSAGTNLTVLATGGGYAVPGLPPGTYTVFPSLYCYAFTNRQVVLEGADAPGVDFAAAPDNAFLVTGRVTAGGAGVEGVTLTAGTNTAKTDSLGYYTLPGLCPTNYVVTPSFPCHSFTPANRAVTLGPSIGDINFETFTNGLFAIRGRVTTNGVGLAGVTLSAGASSALTDGNGYYTLPYLCPGTYSVRASLDGFNFSPASASVTIVSADMTANFTGVPSYRITGLVTVQGTTSPLTETLTVKAVSAATNLVVTTTNGSYSFAGLLAGTYTVTPVLGCYLFTPASQSVSLSSSNAAPTANFSALHDVHSVSGTISAGPSPLSGVAVVAAGANGTTTNYTDLGGRYAFTNLCSGGYSITPVGSCFVFYPGVRSAVVGAGLPDVGLLDFAAYNNVFILRGRVTEIETGAGLSGVVVTAGSLTSVSANGDFTIANVCAGDTVVTPSLAGYLFDPPSLRTNLSADLSPAFTAVPLRLALALSNALASLSFGAPPGITSDLLVSTNLLHWEQVLSTNNTLGKVAWVKFLDAGLSNSPQQFYRVTEVPYLTVSYGSSGTNFLTYGVPPGKVYRLETSADFVNWSPIYTNALSAAPAFLQQIADPAGTNSPIRFYRAVP